MNVLGGIVSLVVMSSQASEGPGVLEVQVAKAVVFGEPVEDREAESFKGSLAKFTKKFVDHENSEGELEFEVVKYGHHLNDAEKIARYAWRILYGKEARTEAPFPCGYKLDGSIDTSGMKSPDNGTVVNFTIKGRGHGSEDTCLGVASPGHWEMSLAVTFNPRTKTGRLLYEIGSY